MKTAPPVPNTTADSNLPDWPSALTLLASVSEGVVVTDPGGRILGANEAFCRLLGYLPEQLLAMRLDALVPAGSLPELSADCFRARWRRADDVIIDVEVNTTACRDGSSRLGFVRDISDLVQPSQRVQRSQALYTFLIEANSLIARSQDIPVLYRELCELAPKIDTRMVLAWVGLVEPSSRWLRVAASAGKALGYLENIQISVDPGLAEGQGPSARSIREQRAVVINDYAQNPVTEPWRQRAEREGIAAGIAIPLLQHGRAIGALMLYSAEVDSFDDDLIRLLVGLGESLSRAIDFSRQHLDRERDLAERRLVVQQLENSQQNLRAILDAADQTIAMIAADGRILAMNKIGSLRFGKRPQAMVGTTLFDMLPAGVAATRRAAIEQALASGQRVDLQDERAGRTYRSTFYPVTTGEPRVVVYAVDVTDVLAAENQLRKLSLAVEQSPVSTVITDLEANIEYVNQAFVDATGYSREEAMGKNPRILQSGKTPRTAYDTLWNQVVNGDVWQGELFNQRKDGTEYVELARISPIRQADGRVTHYLAVKEDITERRRGSLRVRALLDISTLGGTLPQSELLTRGLEQAERITDSSIGFLHFVDEAQENVELVTWTTGAMLGCSVVHKMHYPISRAGIWADSFRQKAPVLINDYPNHAAKHGLPAGHNPLQRLITVPVMENGRVRMILGVGNKASDYIEADIETVQLIGNDLWRVVHRERVELALREALAVVEASPVVSFRWVAAETWPVDYVSSNVVRWGYTPEQFRAGTPRYAEIIHPDDIERVSAEVSRNTAAGIDEYTQQYRVRAADGHYFWVDDHTRILRNAVGRPAYYEGVVNDIDAKKRAENQIAANLAHQRELNRKLEEAQNQLLQSEKMASIGQLAAGVAHELNNPIGFVHSNLGTLDTYLQDIFDIGDAYVAAEQEAATQGPLSPLQVRAQQVRQQKDLDFLRQDITLLMAESKDGLNRVKKIVQDLRDFSRVGETHWQWADLHQCIDSTLNIVRNELKYKCTVTKNYAADLPQIRCLPSQLNQVIMNLLVNASHAIDDQGVITLATRRSRLESGDAVELRISDTGRGIAPEDLSHIFEPFFTTKPIGKGTGLGLSIAWGIVGKHHGTIEVDSQPGVGTCFTLTLPVELPENLVSIAQNSEKSTPAPRREH